MFGTRIHRRRFLKTASVAIAAPCLVASEVLAGPGRPGANDRIHVGLIGPGYRSRDLLKESPADLKLVALADCDLRQIDAREKWLAENPVAIAGGKRSRYQDYRRMLDKERLDGVIVATTVHARVLICLHAMQAGLDVYAEKPLTLTIEEGQYLIRAERKYKTVFQTGTQQRSIPIDNFGSDLVKNGETKDMQCNGSAKQFSRRRLPGKRQGSARRMGLFAFPQLTASRTRPVCVRRTGRQVRPTSANPRSRLVPANWKLSQVTRVVSESKATGFPASRVFWSLPKDRRQARMRSTLQWQPARGWSQMNMPKGPYPKPDLVPSV